MQATKTKAKRGLTIDYRHTFGDGTQLVRLTVVEGTKRNAYFVSRRLDSCEVLWKHASDVTRNYTVVCSAASGSPVACDCPGANYRGECKHKSGTAALLNAGELDNGPTQEDYPEGWGWDAERAEAEDAYHAAMMIGPAVCQYRD